MNVLFLHPSRGNISRTNSIASSWLRMRPSSCASSSTDRKSTRLDSSHANISYAVFCLKKKPEGDVVVSAEPRTTRHHTFTWCGVVRRLVLLSRHVAPCAFPGRRSAPAWSFFFFNKLRPPESSPFPHPVSFPF